jgi:hypothetical protein
VFVYSAVSLTQIEDSCSQTVKSAPHSVKVFTSFNKVILDNPLELLNLKSIEKMFKWPKKNTQLNAVHLVKSNNESVI